MRAATNCEAFQTTLRSASILDGTIIVGAECTRAKPHPDPYEAAAALLGVPMSNCIVFEDSGSGTRAGVAARARAVVGLRTSLDDEAMKALGATTTIADWTELTPALVSSLAATTEGEVAPAVEVVATKVARLAADVRLASLPLLSPLLAAALTMSLTPATAASSCLLCKGDTDIPAAATRAAGAGLLALVGTSYGFTRSAGVQVGVQAAPLLPAGQAALAIGIIASTVVHSMTLMREGHALRRWARRLLLAAVTTSATTCTLASADAILAR